jgi:predicted nuclease of predicted toxin-antitoxin system
VSEPIRFFFDQHIANAVANGLRRHGIDVLTAHDAGRCSLPDDEQLRYATAEGRVVVSHDEDFLKWAADFLARGEAFAGVAFALPEKYVQNIGRLIQALLLVHGVLTADEIMNHVEYL